MRNYETLANRTVSPNFFSDKLPDPKAIQGIMGALLAIGSEADALKRTLFYGAELADTPVLKAVAAESAGSNMTIPSFAPENINRDILHALLGIISECAEIVQAIGKAPPNGADLINLMEEGGDIMWYLALYATAIGSDFDTMQERNIAKLRERFPLRFTEEDALERDLDAEQEALISDLDDLEDDFYTSGPLVADVYVKTSEELGVRAIGGTDEERFQVGTDIVEALQEGNFADVMTPLSLGHAVRRACWPEEARIVRVPGREVKATFGVMVNHLGDEANFTTDDHHDLIFVDVDGVTRVSVGYTMTFEDLSADDWEVF